MEQRVRTKGMEQHPIPIKKPFSNKQPSLISSTRKIKKKQKGRYVHTGTQCGPIFVRLSFEIFIREQLTPEDVTNHPYVPAGFQIIFEGIAGSNFTGDIAIDDIYFTEGSCNRESFTFENVSEDNGGKYWTIHQIVILANTSIVILSCLRSRAIMV